MTAPDKEQRDQQQMQQPIPCNDKHPDDKSVDCLPIACERNHYFTGKFMTARDFTDESNYFLSHAHAHNRLLHGWGIVCGLTVDRREGKPRCLDIHPGIALDCCGRELIVREQITRELPEDTTKYGDDFLICLQYREDMVEFLPALYAEGRAPGHREANRIREGVSVIFKRRSELPGCWKMPSGDLDAPIHCGCPDDDDCENCDDCNRSCCAPGGGCIEPACACNDLIPIARVTYAGDGEWEIEMDGRTVLSNHCLLTQITAINWHHGASTSQQEIGVRYGEDTSPSKLEVPGLTAEEVAAGASDYALLIRFSRKIRVSDGDGTGINPHTFTITTSRGPSRDPYDPDDNPRTERQRHLVRLLDDGYTAIYRFTEAEVTGRENIFNTTLFINLKCDFIIDCNCNAVDGNHLGGKVPTGDGVAGGQFESWTRIVPASAGK